MDCNKEEAMRAKELAEKKMQNKDYVGAQKIILKAQKLFPGMENISQMLTVCDVHCSAGAKVDGEMDWYGILQVESAADDSSIKKQYRKLALLLHPDKNQFAGAEAAFKLIGEAHELLSDRSKRFAYDCKRKSNAKISLTRMPTQPSRMTPQPPHNFTNVTFVRTNQQQQQPSIPSSSQTFWTICHVCGVKYQYYMSILNRSLRCQNCLNTFIARDLNAKVVPSAGNPLNNGGNMEKIPAQQFPDVNLRQSVKAPVAMGSDGQAGGVNQNAAAPTPQRSGRRKRCAGEGKDVSHDKHRGTRKRFKSESSCNVNGKENGTGIANNSDCSSTPVLGSFSYLDPEFGNFHKLRDASRFTVDQIWAVYDNQDGMPRFYAKIKEVCSSDFIIYFTWLEYNPLNENEATWTDAELPVACGNFRLGETEYTRDRLIFSHVVSWKQGKRKKSYDIYPKKGEVWALFKGWNVRWSSETDSDRTYEYEVVEILSDFDLDSGTSFIPLVRIEHYVCLFRRAAEEALTSKVIPPDEMLRFSHYIPSYRLTGNEREGLPEGSLELDCAALPSNFKEMFPPVDFNSSTMGANSGSCLKSVVDNEEPGTCIIQKKSTSLAVSNDGTERSDMEQNHVNEIDLKDSQHGESEAKIHDEGNPGAVKVNDTISDDDKVDGEENHVNESTDLKDSKHVEPADIIPEVEGHDCGNSDAEEINDTISDDANNSSVSSSSPTIQYPDPEFYDFEQGKTVQCGQIWALYSDVDTYPKYYGYVKGVELEKFSVEIAWLEARPVEEEAKLWWFDQDMPLGCGTFRVTRQVTKYNDTNFFSHRVNAQRTGKRMHYRIQPSVGEIWAVYKNWAPGWSLSELKSCKYLVVEICECSDAGMKVNILTKVYGYRSCFRREENRKAISSMEIPVSEYIKFSHQIPAFTLTDESGGKLRGFWELDPASVPTTFLC